MGRNQRSSGCSCRTLVSLFVTVALVATAVGLAVYYLVPGGKELIDANRPQLPPGLEDLPQDLWDRLPDIELFHGESPWAPGMQQNPDDANKWQSDTQGAGLTLELRNALDPEWHSYFDESVVDWDSGTPDALTLKTSIASSPLPECPEDQAEGIMLVCNDDYGETDWKGINKVLLLNGWIIASMARMNDRFFSSGGDEAKRLYTMCHEIGHGFGLPHTDEVFWNRALGNCLDYTTQYETNKRPDTGNYEFLEALYGPIGGENSRQEDTTGNTGNRRQLRTQRRGLFHDVASQTRRRELLADLKQVDSIVDRGLLRTDPRWRMLHQTDGGEAHTMDLGEGYSVQVHLLRA